MTTLPPAISEPNVRIPLVDPKTGLATAHFAHWMAQWYNRLGGGTGIPIIGDVAIYETTVAFSDVASAGEKILLDAAAGEQWKIRDMIHTGGGTNFTGGNRNLDIKSGSTIYSEIPHAALNSLAAARWGDADLPFPATATDMNTATAAGVDLVAAYTGGTTDDTAGSFTMIIFAERIA